MSEIFKCPNIGDFKSVEIIEILVKAGDHLKAEDSLMVLESDKATLDVPVPYDCEIAELLVKVGDKVSEGTELAKVIKAQTGVDQAPAAEKSDSQAIAPAAVQAAPVAAVFKGAVDMQCETLVLGSGPGGYTAAFRAADLGQQVILVEKFAEIGGVCLNVGCIPSKALLHTAQIINETAEMADHGVRFAKPEIDLDKLRGFKDGVLKQLTGGLKALAKQRKVTIVQGYGKFTSPNTLVVTTPEGAEKTIGFQNAIIAAGSRPVKLPFIPHEDPRVMDSTDALALVDIPQRLLVIGGGIIGLEMAQVYDALGSKITVVELMDSIIPGADKDMVRPLLTRIKKRYQNIYLSTKVTKVEATEAGLVVHFDGKKAPQSETFDKVLVAVGRTPNGKLIDAEKAGVVVNQWGFIEVDERMRTNVPHIYAIGDIVGQPMLAHKAVHEGKVAAEVIAGEPAAFTPMVIPGVAYTDPEVAYVGVTEEEAKAKGLDVEVGVFPWAASGRSLSIGRNEGLTKAIFDKATGRIIGAAMTGPNAGELVAEAVLAIEMGADAQDIGASIHPHPTLSETFAMAAEMAEGTITDLIAPKKKKH